MKYRIKTITYKDGSVKYEASIRYYFIFYKGITIGGYEKTYKKPKLNTRKDAVEAIDIHYNKSLMNTKQSIQIEYINK